MLLTDKRIAQKENENIIEYHWYAAEEFGGLCRLLAERKARQGYGTAEYDW